MLPTVVASWLCITVAISTVACLQPSRRKGDVRCHHEIGSHDRLNNQHDTSDIKATSRRHRNTKSCPNDKRVRTSCVSQEFRAMKFVERIGYSLCRVSPKHLQPLSLSTVVAVIDHAKLIQYYKHCDTQNHGSELVVVVTPRRTTTKITHHHDQAKKDEIKTKYRCFNVTAGFASTCCFFGCC